MTKKKGQIWFVADEEEPMMAIDAQTKRPLRVTMTQFQCILAQAVLSGLIPKTVK